MSNILQLVGFRIEEEFFGVPIGKVKEIVRVPEVTAVPDTPDFLNGVINLRGRVIPVIEMSRRLGVASSGPTKSNRVLVLDLGGSTVGLLVGSVSEILKIEEESVEQKPDLVSSIGGEYVNGIGKLKDRLIVLIDIEKLLSPEEIRNALDAGAGAGRDEEADDGLGEPEKGLDRACGE